MNAPCRSRLEGARCDPLPHFRAASVWNACVNNACVNQSAADRRGLQGTVKRGLVQHIVELAVSDVLPGFASCLWGLTQRNWSRASIDGRPNSNRPVMLVRDDHRITHRTSLRFKCSHHGRPDARFTDGGGLPDLAPFRRMAVRIQPAAANRPLAAAGNMLKPPSQKILSRQTQLPFRSGAVVAIPENHTCVINGHDAVVRDRAPDNVPCQVSRHGDTVFVTLLNPDIPETPAQTVQQGLTPVRRCGRRNDQTSGRDSGFQFRNQLCPKHDHQHAGREQGLTLLQDKFARLGQTTRRHQAMHMRMDAQIPPPRMQRADDPRLRTQVPRVRQQFQQPLTRRAQQRVGKRAAIELPVNVQRVGDRENDMHMIARQQIAGNPLEPRRTLSATASRATAVPAGVITDLFDMAALTTLHIGTERCGAALQSGAIWSWRPEFSEIMRLARGLGR